MQKEIQRIASMFKVVNHTTPWHGSSIKEIVDDITAQEAATKVISDGHSIWEIVEHLICWRNFVINNLSKNQSFQIQLNTEADWPKIADTSESNWTNTIDRLNHSTGELMSTMLRFKNSLLDEFLPEREYSYYALLHGIIQHDIYHSGQISLLKKIIRSNKLAATNV